MFYDSTSSLLYVTDTYNNRVLAYSMPLAANSGDSASLVVGQSSMTANQVNQGSTSVNANDLYLPWSVSAMGTTLLIADTFNNRVLHT